MMRALLLSVVVAFHTAACGADLPNEFQDAEEIELFQSGCGGSALSEEVPPASLTKALVDEDGMVTGEVTGLGFRCSQEACGYAVETGNAAKVLLQPCDMDPGVVAACDCLYDFDFKWEAYSPSVLEVWMRGDDSSGIELKLVDKDKLTRI